MTTTFHRAFLQSTVGHFAVFGIAAIALTISQCAHPAAEIEDVIEVSLLSGPKTSGEFGAPPPPAAPPQNYDVTPPPPAPIPQPVIKEPTPVKIEEPPTPKPPEIPKPPDTLKPPDKPLVEEKKPPQPAPEKPQKHVVQKSTNVIVLAQNKPEPKPPQTSRKKITGPPLTDTELAKLLSKNLPESKHGGGGLRDGGPPGAIERGNQGSVMDGYKAALKAKLYNAWQRPVGVEGMKTVIGLSIARDGTFISATIIRRSGNEQMDQSSMQAVRTVRPAPLPPGTDAPYPIEIEFDASGVSV